MDRKVFENGIHDISNYEYHNSAGISRSMLMQLKKSPYHYDKIFNNPDYTPPAPTRPLIMGDVTHTLVLEGHKTEERYVIKPNLDRRTKAGKIEYEKFLCSVQGRIIIENDIYNDSLQMALSIRDNDLAQAILQDAKIEQSIYFTHEPTGLQCKVRPDIWNGSLVGDLKTTKDASYHAFQRSAFNFGYFIQAGMISEALKSIDIILEKFIFIGVENTFPNSVAIYQLEKDCIDYGVQQYNYLMLQLKDCINKQSFPSYPFATMFLPVYSQYQINNEVQHDD